MDISPSELEALQENGSSPDRQELSERMEQFNLGMLLDVTLQLSVELGRTQMSVRQVLALQEGSVVELNRQAGEAVDIFINNHVFARGEVVVVDDKFGVRITELVQTPKKA